MVYAKEALVLVLHDHMTERFVSHVQTAFTDQYDVYYINLFHIYKPVLN